MATKKQIPVDPRRDCLSSLSSAHHWVIGAAIFQTTTGESNPPKLLLVKRAATESSFANHWELPGGGIESTDGCVWDAVVREVKEETGLDVTGLVGRIDDMEWQGRSRHHIQLNYVVGVEQEDRITLNPDEHGESKWVEMDEVKQLYMSQEMRVLVEDAFQYMATRGNS